MQVSGVSGPLEIPDGSGTGARDSIAPPAQSVCCFFFSAAPVARAADLHVVSVKNLGGKVTLYTCIIPPHQSCQTAGGVPHLTDEETAVIQDD